MEARETDCGEDEGAFAGGKEDCEQRMDHSSLHLSDPGNAIAGRNGNTLPYASQNTLECSIHHTHLFVL